MEKFQPLDSDFCGRLLMFVLNVEAVQRRVERLQIQLLQATVPALYC